MVSEYLERLCIFICIAELLGNFLPSEKFIKWYRYIVGIFVLVLMIQPLQDGIEILFEKEGNQFFSVLETDQKDAQEFWEWENSYLDQLNEEQLITYLKSYGYIEE